MQKTKIVYCKDDNRRGDYPEQKFDFLGFTFRPRRAKDRSGVDFSSDLHPAISNKATKSICDTMRRWKLHRRSDKSLDELAQMIQPSIKGMDQLLRQLLQVSPVPDLSASEQYSCSVGNPEIQKIEEA